MTEIQIFKRVSVLNKKPARAIGSTATPRLPRYWMKSMSTYISAHEGRFALTEMVKSFGRTPGSNIT